MTKRAATSEVNCNYTQAKRAMHVPVTLAIYISFVCGCMGVSVSVLMGLGGMGDGVVGLLLFRSMPSTGVGSPLCWFVYEARKVSEVHTLNTPACL